VAFSMCVLCRQPCRSPCLPAAHLTRIVGPLSPRHTVRNAVAGQTQQRDIIGHHQAYSGHISDIFRSYFGYEMIIACGIAGRRTRRQGWSSRAVGPVAGSRAVCLCHSGDRTSLPYPRSGNPNARHRPCPGPTAACSRRRPQRFTNIYSFVWLWRSLVVPSAARLRRIVGPLIKALTMPDFQFSYLTNHNIEMYYNSHIPPQHSDPKL